MDFNQLETFLAVVDTGSFSRGADRRNLTQPAVSLSIRRLEEEVGEPLFDRTIKGGSLTEAGRSLASYARQMLNLREEALLSIQELQGLFRGRLSLGANESISQYLLPPLLLAFRKAHPAIRIEVYRNLSEKIPSEILERNLDFGFLSYEPTDPRLESRIIARDEHVLVVDPNHPFVGRKDLRLRDLGDQSFLAHNARTPSRDRVVQSFTQAGVPLRITMELDSLQTIIDFVVMGMGAAILPRIAMAQALAAGQLVEVPIVDLKIRRSLRIVHRKEHALSSAARAFLELFPEDDALAAPSN